MNPDQQASPAPAAQPEPQMPAPAPAPGMPPTPMSGQTVTGGKKKTGMMIGILVAALVVLAGVGYGVYAYISNTPDNMMKAAVGNLGNAKTLAATFKIASDDAATGTSLSGDLAYNVDPANSKNAEIIVNVGTGDSQVGLRSLALGDTAYVKFMNLEHVGALISAFAPSANAAGSAQLATLFKSINDIWFVVTPEETKTLTGNENIGSASPEDVKKVVNIYEQHSFVKADKTFADEAVNGANSAHFSLKVDKDQMVAFLQGVKDANLKSFTVTDEDITKAKDAKDDSKTTIEVWIARDSKQFTQLKLVSTDSESPMSMTLTMTKTLPTFDKFEKPAGARPLSDMTLIMQQSLGLGSGY